MDNKYSMRVLSFLAGAALGVASAVIIMNQQRQVGYENFYQLPRALTPPNLHDNVGEAKAKERLVSLLGDDRQEGEFRFFEESNMLYVNGSFEDHFAIWKLLHAADLLLPRASIIIE